ncbi:ATP-dependent 3'-5' DNA helicase [Tritrichomonas musculus]|uniref:DNA 3'-5' helicase n=1 Tax=Tritrichomonas musculus TaxID=1915356 RepID=A0ABR2JW66_9EUKA
MDLNCTEEQKTAINAPFDKPVAIIACPGSGKTFTIIHRVAHLLRSGYRPSDLLVITFTRKASRELRTRLKSMNINTSGLTVQTFHSFGLLILRRYKHLLNIGEFRIITQKEQMEILESVAKATPNKEILLRLQIYKTQGQCEDELRPIFDSYNKELRNTNSCDFTDLIVLPLEIMRRNPEVVTYYQRRYKYALVDEMQDVSKVQFDFMKILFGDRGRLTVVGDDDQTIYTWRGADARLLLQFTKVYQQAAIIRLTNCFRCPPHIVKAMSNVIQNNKSRVEKTIESMVKSNTPMLKYSIENRKIKKIKIYGANNLKDEAYLIVADLKRFVGRGTVAILYRTRKAAQYIKAEMTKQAVLAIISDRARFLEAEDVNIVLNILQMSVGMPFNEKYVRPNSLTILRMSLTFAAEAKKEKNKVKNKKTPANLQTKTGNGGAKPTCNLSLKTDLASVSNDKQKKEVNVIQPLKVKITGTLSPNTKKFLESDSDIDDEIESIFESETKKNILSINDDNDQDDEPSENDSDKDYVIKSLRKMSPVEAISIITKSLNMDSENINFLLKEANELESLDDSPFQEDNESGMSLIDFLYSVRTSTTEESSGSNDIHLSTIHQAKGLEWDYVYIIGASKGSWPSTSSTMEENEAKLEEERRLFYVAMSRAKKELVISFLTDKGQSMFIDEIPSILIKEKIHRRTDTSNEDNLNIQVNSGNGDSGGTKKSNGKVKISSDELKFIKVSSMADSQPSPPKFSTQFVSASNLKLNLMSDSQGSAQKPPPSFRSGNDILKDSSLKQKKKTGKPQLVLQEFGPSAKTKQAHLKLF